MSNFSTTGFGNETDPVFETGGVAELYVLPYAKIKGKYTPVIGTISNTIVAVSDIVLGGSDKFIEIGFVEGQASYTDGFAPSNTKKFMEMVLNFTVDTSGQDAIDKAHSLLLQRKIVALVRRKNDKWYLLGQSFGLKPAPGNANSGAASGDDSGMTFSFTGANLGYAAEVVMTDAEIEAIITRL